HSPGRWAVWWATALGLLWPVSGAVEWGTFVEPGAPAFSTVLDAPNLPGAAGATRNLTPRGLVIRVTDRTWACFDVDLLRWSAIWEGDGVTPVSMSQGSYASDRAGQKAPEGQRVLPEPAGRVRWVTGTAPGWARGVLPAWTDPRPRAPDPTEVGLGPLPVERGRFRAWGVDGSGPWVEYDAEGARVRERWGVAASSGDRRVLERRVRCAPCAVDRWMAVGQAMAAGEEAWVVSNAGDGGFAGTRRRVEGVDAILVPASSEPREFAIRYGAGSDRGLGGLLVADSGPGAPGVRWGQSVETMVNRGQEGSGAVVLDLVGLPRDNPWRRNVRLADVAFFEDGRAVGVTFDGDVWWIDGLGEDAGSVVWRRFASGLHEPMSLAVRSNAVVVFDRNGLWRLRDTDGNGECDVHEMVSSAFAQTAETREYANSMKLAPDGSYVIAKGGQQGTTTGRHNGTVLRVREGKAEAEVLAYGLRQPFLGVHPRTGLITASDQQGHYVPTTPLHLIGGGQFYGFLSLLLPKERYPAPIAEPLTWIPHAVNASAVSQVWLVDSRMGPLDGAMIHLGYYRPELFLVRVQERAARPQAAVMSLTRELPFPPLNGAVNPRDGLLYVAGFQIWGTEAQEISGLARVRPVGGRPFLLPREVAALKEGVLLRFDVPLDPTTATNAANYLAERWNYVRSAEYGSAHYRLDGTKGQEVMPASSAYLSRDRRSVLVGIPDLRPVMQMRLAWSIRDASGRAMSESACLTPHVLTEFEAEREGFDPVSVDLTPRAFADVALTPVTPAEGRRLAELMGCVACHSNDGTTVGKVGPSWKGLFGASRRFVDGSEAVADESYLRQSIEEPSARVLQGFEARDTGMPSYAGILSPDQVSALIAYLQTLR
ncbi:MAG: c-type cytochrome, partial [Verrucomicrobiales bacterium]|nr:c-type cytochrome [Verrucomicrobiales bacterium]